MLAAGVVLTQCAAPAPAPSPPPTQPAAVPAAEPDERPLRSDEALASIVDPALPGCSAAVGVQGAVVWAGAAGLADLEAGIPITTRTRFDMASVAKQFTATAILLLERDGAVRLTDTVGTHVDGLPAWGRTVTLDQLMHHTSRIRDYWIALEAEGLGFGDPVDHAHILRAIGRLGTLSPGSGFEYSNSNYVLLAEVVHRVSGMPLPQFLEQRIFAPLDLDMQLAPALTAADVALSYDDDLTLQQPGWAAYGPVGIYTTPSELARWGDQYRAGGLVQGDVAAGAVDQGEGELYGAGIDIHPDGTLGHNGRFGGHITTFTVSADRQTTVVVMCNGHASPRFPLADALRAIWEPETPLDAGSD